MLVLRPGVVAVLNEFKIEKDYHKDELCRIFILLVQNGAGQWVGDEFAPTAALYDVELLRLILKVMQSESRNARQQKAAILAIKHLESRSVTAA